MTYIIGEIGQNHNGSVDIAKLIIDLASKKIEERLFGYHLEGINAIKLTKRDLSQELSKSEMVRAYDSINSFGKTYGEHRRKLELSDQQHFEIFKYAKSKKLDFIETLCSIGCLSLLKLFQPDFLKIASRDLTNIPLIDALAQTKIPMILSTGMSCKDDLDDAIHSICKYHSKISILHCVSEYPTRPENVNLNTISFLKKHYSQYKIGFSDHTVGISAPIAAVSMGAEIIEKHITINREMKGTDQKGSLGPQGISRMLRDIRCLEMSFGKEDLFVDNSVLHAKNKLERSIASKKIIRKGQVINKSDIHLLSPGNGFRWSQIENVIGKKAINDIYENEIILENMIK